MMLQKLFDAGSSRKLYEQCKNEVTEVTEAGRPDRLWILQ